jgi:hypothetical protein
MSIRRSGLGAALAVLLSVPWALSSAAAEPHATFCMFSSFQVSDVGSLYVGSRSGRGADAQRFAGARLFLPAQPGLTPEWIQANLAKHAAEAKGHPSKECPLDVPGATFSVNSAGDGFWVAISAKDSAGAKEVLDRARMLVR